MRIHRHLHRLVALTIVVSPAVAAAHGGGHGGGGHVDEELVIDALTALVLLLAAAGYALGLARLRARGQAISYAYARAVAYTSGLAAIALAQLSPIDTWSEIKFSAHMGQHELLVLFAAPLVVVGRPELVMRAALPAGVRKDLGNWAHRPAMVLALRVLGNRWFAVVLHGVTTWLWHVPVLFEAALHSESIHALQHLTFFGTSALFWWSMARGRYGRMGYGIAVVFVFITAMHKGLLAMLFTVAGRTFYPTHVARTEALGHDALSDQQLAGLLMWVPAGAVMAALALALFVAWLGAIERRAERSR
jgi:putative membrane protein